MINLEVGKKAPDIELEDQGGKTHKLSSYLGKNVVLFFYPKDDTPGCTKEVCNFRDDYSSYKDANVVLLGVSPDDTKSHAKFVNKFDLPFPLLADTKKEVVNAYGVWGAKKMFGKEYKGVFRTTFLIDSEGNIAKIFKNVKPAEHSVEVLKAVSEI